MLEAYNVGFIAWYSRSHTKELVHAHPESLLILAFLVSSVSRFYMLHSSSRASLAFECGAGTGDE